MIAAERVNDGPSGAFEAAEGAVSPALVWELQGWHLAKEAASRHNRNFLQYAAGLAAVLGINVGGGGMLAIAKSLREASGRPDGPTVSFLPLNTPIDWILAVAMLVGAALLLLVTWTFMRRQAAEGRAERHLERLIALAPQWFEPKD
jgi:hypothetical protein